MKRRTFLQTLGVMSALPNGSGSAVSAELTNVEQELRRAFDRKNDNRISDCIRSQLLEVNSSVLGGFPNQHGICSIGSAAWRICYMVAGLISSESAHFQSAEVERRLNLAMDFLTRMQHDDGTIDLYSTNFHSPPDTAFVVEPLAIALGCVRRHQPNHLQYFQAAAAKFLTNAGRALARGGVHTPNHRWVVCMALARIHHLLPDNCLVRRVDQWLAEGIDIDSDGQYTERSTSVYTPTINRCLITMARLLDRTELYEPVRGNLEMTRFLIRPNGELVTEISRRQDQFQRKLAGKYYYSYCFMARLDNNGAFSAMARFIEETVGREQLYSQFIYNVEDPGALEPLPPAAPLDVNYEKYFSKSNIVRIRRDNVDASIIADNPTIFTLHVGAAVLQSLRLASAFFGKGQFRASTVEQQTIEEQDGPYMLTQHLTGSYLQPLPPDLLSGDGDWANMPHTRRAKSGAQQLTTTILIRETNNRFKIHFVSNGSDRVPWAIELGLRPGGKLSGVTPIDGIPEAYLAGDGVVTYQVGEDVIRFSPGPVEHQWTQIRGALPKLNAKSVYLTGFTPLDFEMTIW